MSLSPGFKIFGVVHLDEEDAGLSGGVHAEAELGVGGAGLEVLVGKNHLC
jgi:hypothetical protein